MPRIRCLLGHDWGEWTSYWEDLVGGEVRRKRRCKTCQQEQDEHLRFGRPNWVGTGEAPALPSSDRKSIVRNER